MLSLATLALVEEVVLLACLGKMDALVLMGTVSVVCVASSVSNVPA